MKRRDLTVTIALCVSLMAHGMGMLVITENEIHGLEAQLYQGPLDWKAWLARRGRLHEDQEQKDVAQALPALVSLPEVEDLFGERGAKGKGMNASPGEQPMQSQQGSQEQAALTKHPGQMEGASDNAAGASQGNGAPARPSADGASADHPSAQLAMIFPESGADAPLGVPLMPLPQQIPAKLKKPLTPDVIGTPRKTFATPTTQNAVATIQEPATKPSNVVVASALQITPPAAPSPKSPAPPPAPSALPAQQVASASAGASRAVGGEVGHTSESESDPFSDKPMVVWKDGKVEARDGRKVKSVRPKLTDAGRIALMEMEERVIIVAVHIDETGSVTAVDFLRKSNVPEVDLPHYRCAFDWWFEPSKDKNGNPKPDVLVLPFVWY